MAINSKPSTADKKVSTTPVDVKATAVNVTTETKSTAKKAVEAKADVKAPAKTAEPAAKKPAAKKAAPAKKTTKKDVTVNTSYVLQYAGKEVIASTILETVKTMWVEKFQGKLEEIKTIEIYIKPEENRAYFVINGLSNGDYFVEL